MIQVEGKIVPTAPPMIREALYRYDKNLHLNFDPVMYCWQVWRRDDFTGQLHHLFNYLNPDGSYRELSSSIIDKLNECRWNAEHPDELRRLLVDNVYKQIEREQKAVHDDMVHISKDIALKKRFNEIKEKIKSVSIKDWATKRVLKNQDGSVARGPDGKPVEWIPHSSLTK